MSNLASNYTLDNHSKVETHIAVSDYGLCVIYCLVAALIVFGNSLVITSIVRFRYLRTITNIYILFLACSDVMVSISMVYGGAFILNQITWQTQLAPCLLRYSLITYSVTASMSLHVGKLKPTSSQEKYMQRNNPTNMRTVTVEYTSRLL